MTKDEALRLALEALEFANVNHWWGSSNIEQAITAIKEALAQPEQEPVAFASHGVVNWIADKQFQHEAHLYSAPQRTWVGLTDEEIRKWWASENGLEDCDMCKIDDFILVAKAIEAKLKEKNT